MSRQPFATIETNNGVCECYSYKAFRILAEKLVAKSTQMMVEDAMIYGAGAIKIEHVDPQRLNGSSEQNNDPTLSSQVPADGAWQPKTDVLIDDKRSDQAEPGQINQINQNINPVDSGNPTHSNVAIANYHWALSRVSDYRLNNLNSTHFGEGDIARLICKLIEEPETLERSDLYRIRMTQVDMQVTQMARANSCTNRKLIALGYRRDVKGDWVDPMNPVPAPIEQVASYFEDRDNDSRERELLRLREKVDELTKTLTGIGEEFKQIVEIAEAHGWSIGQGSVAPILKQWLDNYVVSHNECIQLKAQVQHQAAEIKRLNSLQALTNVDPMLERARAHRGNPNNHRKVDEQWNPLLAG